ncbi:type II secretion system protein [Planctomycetales bacterium ZRK34]|nr:type II secretion system protein [Planctomycetales bacterium ZRK34]
MGRCGFTLLELLVSVAIIAVMISLLLPALAGARTSAKVVRVHADLRQIDHALIMYAMDWRGALPPSRASCATQTEYPLPVELAQRGYLLRGQTTAGGLVEHVNLIDVFSPDGDVYHFRAPGPLWLNETSFFAEGAKLWAPDDFPRGESSGGQYYNDPFECPARYATWSVGPEPEAAKLLINPGRGPMLRRLWYTGLSDPGWITHFQDQRERIYTSP